jgi:hypothetical protein
VKQKQRFGPKPIRRLTCDERLPKSEDTRRLPLYAQRLARSLVSQPAVDNDDDDDATKELPRPVWIRSSPLAMLPSPLPKGSAEIVWGELGRADDDGVDVLFDDFDEVRAAPSEIRLVATDRSELGTENTDEWIALRLSNCLGR